MQLHENGAMGPFVRNPVGFFFASQGWPSARRLLIMLVLLNTIAIIVTSYDGTLHSQGDFIGLAGDVFHFILITVIIVVFWLVVRVVNRSIDFFEFVPQLVTGESSRRALHDLANRAIASIRLETEARGARVFFWGVIGSFLGLAVYFSLYLPLSGDAVAKSWALTPYEHPLSFSYSLIWATFVWPIVLGSFAWYLFASGYFVYRTITLLDDEGEIALSPVSPDGMGGLSVVGDIVLVAGIISAMIGFASFAWIQQFESTQAVSIAALIYLPAVLFIVGGPIWNLVRVIRRSKNKQLDHLTRVIQANFPTQQDQTLLLLEETEIRDQEEIDRLEFYSSLVNLYRRFEDLSVWPVGPGKAILTFVAYVSPVAQVLLQLSGAETAVLQYFSSIWISE